MRWTTGYFGGYLFGLGSTWMIRGLYPQGIPFAIIGALILTAYAWWVYRDRKRTRTVSLSP